MAMGYKQMVIRKVPRDWKVAKLKKIVVECKTGIPVKQQDRIPGPYPYFGANGVIDYVHDHIFDGDYIIVAQDGSIGAIQYFSGKFWANNHVWVIKVRSSASLKFMYYILQTLNWKRLATGSTRPKVTEQILLSADIPLPPIKEQRKIVEVLSVVDLAIGKVDEVIAKTERLKKGLMQELLTKGIGHKEFKDTKIGKTPKTWQIVEFREIIDMISGRYFKFSEFCEEGIRCLKIDNVGFGEVVWETSTFLPNNYVQKYPELVLKGGDIVLALNRPIIDNKVKVGMLKKEDYPSILYQRVGKVIIKDKTKIDKRFLAFAFTGEHFKRQLGHSLIGTDQPYVRTPILLKIKTPLPPVSEQQRIAEIFSAVDKKLELERKEKAKLERIKWGLMDLLLTGKVRVKVAD